jgi:hypothetical protein
MQPGIIVVAKQELRDHLPEEVSCTVLGGAARRRTEAGIFTKSRLPRRSAPPLGFERKDSVRMRPLPGPAAQKTKHIGNAPVY